MYKKLVIISHTEHYLKDNVICGWGPTVTEINFLSNYWDEIVHIATLHHTNCPNSSLPYKSNIRFVGLPPFGGSTILSKIKIILIFFKNFKCITSELINATDVQLRLPMGLGICLLPYFSFFKRDYKFWIKYAGNWNEKHPPFGYRLQRFWLKNNLAKCIVTINGFWNNQPTNCISFENPCLFQNEITYSLKIFDTNKFKPPYKFIFIGRMDKAKGIFRIIDCLKSIPNDLIEKIFFIGDFNDVIAQTTFIDNLPEKCIYYGSKNRLEIHNLLRESHFLLLPSTASEGFPKVIAEAACYGVIPIVSNVGSISHYINDKNGFLWNVNDKETFSDFIGELFIANTINDFKLKSSNILKISNKFTFEHLYSQLKGNNIIS
jgi:glycosyltransferase involved in cell wall biosynthesis